MAYHVIIEKPVSRAIGAIGLSRTALVRLLTTLHDELTNNAEQYRGLRIQEDPHLFAFRVTLVDGGLWHLCDFAVNDTTAQGFLLVEELTHHSRPIPP